MFLNYGKKLLVVAMTLFCLFSLRALNAQSSDTVLLQQIAANTLDIKGTNTTIQTLTTTIRTTTDSILEKVNSLPTILEKLGEFIDAWMNEDDSDTTEKIVENFTGLGKRLGENMAGQLDLQKTLNKDLLTGVDPAKFDTANDIIYSNLLTEKFFIDPDPRKKENGKDIVPQLNYIKNAAGINLRHTVPGIGWSGSTEDQIKYRSYFNTVMSVASYNGYVLSDQYIDGPKFNDLQKKLIDQATDSDKWFTIVASQKIGFVLRQLLMYQSQVFVLLTQLVQTQKQMATAQVMTNALLIANGMYNETYFLSRAQGVRP